MAWRCGSFSRTVMASARASSFRSPPSLPRLRPPSSPASAPRRRLSFAPSRNFGELGCAQSLMPFMVAAGPLASHLAVKVRASCELPHGT